MALHANHQHVVVDSIKELLKVVFHTPAVTRDHMGAGYCFGFVGASARTEAVAVFREQRGESRRELLQQCLLDQTVHDAGDTQVSCSAYGLGDFDGAHT